MKKMIKKILISAIAIFGANLIFILPASAQIDPLVIEFEKTPLFDEANFLPGQSIARWVKVTNNGSQSQRIAVEAINVSDPDKLADALNLEIKEEGTRIFNGPLSQFFNAGEVYLSELAGGGTQTQYDFIVTFYSGANNAFQGKTVGFDILVGFQGTEGGLSPGGGTGGGGFLPPGLTITNETAEKIGTTEVTITWLTSYSSTSQVIYAKDGEPHILDLTDNAGAPPKYGYAHTTLEYDTTSKVTSHSVTITGLTPATKYYYRAVSHASLAVSIEHSFTTLSVVGEEEPSYAPEGAMEGEEEEEVWELEGPELVEVELEEPTGLGKFLAAIGAFPFNLKVILVIVALILIILIILWLSKRKKNK